MPTRLARLEIQGYKSFATKSEFQFGEGITCIVGPNGSGKSNIADGLRWVLGEQSFSLLRGRKTEDMIFSGSEKRARAGMAAVTVVFDNSDGWLPIDFSEVSITRRAYRDGHNEYLLNGQKTRLREISGLLGTVGLAQRTYTVMGQGLVDAALSLKADERRALFEEAAGIGNYRQKRVETLRRLDQTQRNLERVQDILAEIGPRLRSLERQARKAEQYEQVKTDLHALLRIWYGYHWHAMQQAVSATRVYAEDQARELAALQTEQAQSDTALANIRARIAAQRAQRDDWRTELAQRQSEHEALQREMAVAAERVRNLDEQRAARSVELEQLEENFAAMLARLDSTRAETVRLEADREAARQQLAELEAHRAQNEREREALTDQITQAQQSATDLARQITELQARQEALRGQRPQLESERKRLAAELESAGSAVVEQEAKLAERTTAVERASREREAAEQKQTDLTSELAAVDTQLADAAAQLAAALAKVERLQARQEVLSQQRAAAEGAASGRQRLQQAAHAGQFAGRQGDLIDLLQTPPEYDAAIAAALGPALQATLVADHSTVEAAREMLAAQGGRATLFPLDEQRPVQRPAVDAPHPDMIAWAAELVQCAPQHRPAVDALLGRAAVCRTREAARRIAAGLPPGALAVTLAGEVYHAEGTIVVGKDASARALAFAREAHALPDQLKAAEAARRDLETRRDALAGRREQLQLEIEQIQAARNAALSAEQEAVSARDEARLEVERVAASMRWNEEQLATLAERAQEIDASMRSLDEDVTQLTGEHAAAHQQAQTLIAQRAALASLELAEQIAAEQTALAVAEQALRDARARLQERHAAHDHETAGLTARRERIASLEAEATQLNATIEMLGARAVEFQHQIADLQGKIEPAEHTLADLETKLSRAENSEGNMRTALHAAERGHVEARLEYESKRGELEALQRRIQDDFGLVALEYSADITGQSPLPLEGQVERLERVDELPDGIEDAINRRRGQLRRMGAINPDAMQEHAEVKARHEHLTTQIADLEAAAAQMREVIAELDLLMEREFRKTFDAVAREFRTTFKQLFGGGSAQLTLTSPDDLTNTGIDIMAQLPGRRQQGLALLSGGERSLTACALIFALLRVSPTPFALLDEVDAMLDEANVGRFRELLRDLSQQTQFVIITHNRHTVEVAETVYGISMGADGVSQTMSLRLDGAQVKTPAAVG